MTTKTKPTRPHRVKKNPPVTKPAPLETKKETEEPPKMKYSKRDKVGTPTLGRSKNFVTTVGLGNLEVITTNGYTDV